MLRRACRLVVCVCACWLLAGPRAWAQPTNVILLISDGMGAEHVKAAGMFSNGAPGTLCFEALPYQGEITTHSASSSVTDSAAAGTAIATGVKVNNGVISMAYPGDGSELEALLEYFQARDKSTGLVTTTYLTHATPAAFGAHEPSRYNSSGIANDYVTQTRPDVLLGGGGHGMPASPSGYTVVTDRAGLLGLDTEGTTRVAGLFGGGHLPYEYDGLGGLPHLSEMTSTALAILDNDPDGFFLMVEGGLIDQAAHANHIARTVWETVEFANAAQQVLDWAAGRSDTLVLVTADHETGGLTVLANNGAGALPSVSWSTGSHTAANVPVYAWGPNADLVSGVMDNTDLFAVATSVTSVEIGIDIKPGGDSNALNLRAKGVLPVAVLGSETFDVHDVDQTSLELEGAGPRANGGSGRIGRYEDVNGDSFADLVIHFPVPGLMLAADATEAELTGQLLDGTGIFGSDAIKLVGGNGSAAAGQSAQVGAVPEPVTVSLLIVGACAIVPRRPKTRRRQG